MEILNPQLIDKYSDIHIHLVKYRMNYRLPFLQFSIQIQCIVMNTMIRDKKKRYKI